MRAVSRAWIFVSHSTKDISAIRRIRNELEARGAEPLLFFLKAIEEEEELRVLLWREIRARTHFLLCDSEASRGSKWVGKEHEYVRKLVGKHITTVSLDWSWEQQLKTILGMLRLATVFLSYAHHDRERVRPYRDVIIQHDFAVWSPEDMEAGEQFEAEIRRSLEVAARDGFFVLFISERSLLSPWVLMEVTGFQRLQPDVAKLIVVQLEPAVGQIPLELDRVEFIRSFAHNFDESARLLMGRLGLRQAT